MDEAGALVGDRDTSPREVDDAVARAAHGDPQAFAEIYARHRLAVFRYLRARSPSEEAAADLTALTFERALAAMPRYRAAGGGVLAWLLTIARNAAIDVARRPHPVPLDARAGDRQAASGPDEDVIARERTASLRSAIDALPELQREAIRLRYAARLTAREIGTVLGKSESATQKLISRALASLRENHHEDLR